MGCSTTTVGTMQLDEITRLDDITPLDTCSHISLARISHRTISGSRLICQSSSSESASLKIAILSSPFCDIIAGRSRHDAAV